MDWKERWKNYPLQVLISFDQLLNALIPPFITLSWADETLSARTYRAFKRGKPVAKVAMPVIDFLFRWQGWKNHCERAYETEMLRRNSPPEYREQQRAQARV